MRNVPHHVVWVKVADLPWKVELRNIPSHLFRGIWQRVFNVLNKYLFTFAFDSGSSRSSGPGPGQLSIAEHFHVVSGFGLRVRGGWVRHLSSTLVVTLVGHKSFVTPNDDDENVRRRMRRVQRRRAGQGRAGLAGAQGAKHKAQGTRDWALQRLSLLMDIQAWRPCQQCLPLPLALRVLPARIMTRKSSPSSVDAVFESKSGSSSSSSAVSALFHAVVLCF